MKAPPLKIVVIFPSPVGYRHRLFEIIGSKHDAILRVLYCSRDRSGRTTQPATGASEAYSSMTMPGFSLSGSEGSGRPGLYINPWLPRYLRGDVADVVVVSGYSYPSALLALVVAGQRRIPAVLLTSTHQTSGRAGRYLASVKRVFLRRIVSMCSAFLALGTPQERYLVDLGADPSAVFKMGQGVDTHALRLRIAGHRTSREAAERELGVPTGPFVATIMRLSHEKRPMDLISAFKTFNASHENWKLLLAGDGPLREKLRQQIRDLRLEDRVFLLGAITSRQVEILLAISDIFCLPSGRETWGTVVDEALAAGLPCIVTDRVGSAEDLIGSSGAGLVVPHANPGALSSGLARLADDPAVRAEMSRRALQTAAAFSAESAANSFLAACRYALTGQ